LRRNPSPSTEGAVRKAFPATGIDHSSPDETLLLATASTQPNAKLQIQLIRFIFFYATTAKEELIDNYVS
jgi:hypothetical protein